MSQGPLEYILRSHVASQTPTQMYHDFGFGLSDIGEDLLQLRNNPELSEEVVGLLDVILEQLPRLAVPQKTQEEQLLDIFEEVVGAEAA
jgi:hypothetical protein